MSLTLTEALRRLHAAGRIAHTHRDGMAYVTGSGLWRPEPRDVDIDGPPNEEPSFEDAATCGCLLSLLREAMGHPTLCMDVHWPNVDGSGVGPQTRWCVWDPANDWEGPHARTEGEAVARALVQLAGEVAP